MPLTGVFTNGLNFLRPRCKKLSLYSLILIKVKGKGVKMPHRSFGKLPKFFKASMSPVVSLFIKFSHGSKARL